MMMVLSGPWLGFALHGSVAGLPSGAGSSSTELSADLGRDLLDRQNGACCALQRQRIALPF